MEMKVNAGPAVASFPEISVSHNRNSRKTYPGSLLCDWLDALGVEFTVSYSRKREKEMPFKTWFGLARLLKEYGLESEGYRIEDKEKELDRVPLPFIAHTEGTSGGNIIVTSVNRSEIGYLSQGVEERVVREKFLKAWDGDVFISYPDENSAEPDYRFHARLEWFEKAKKWVLLACAGILFLYAFVSHGLYRYVSAYFITAINIGGLYVTYLLVQKSLKIHNPTADRFCGVLQAGGCDDILSTPASKFFGLFGWSEVGFAYFSVSLLATLIFPESLPWIALCNVCCLPFTIWSIWYQKFRAGRWCTLCVTVQGSLWLLFICYLSGGWLKKCLPLSVDFILLCLSYLGMMLLINAIMPLISRESE